MAVSTSIPKPMRDAILRALAKDRDDRFDTVSDFVAAMASGASTAPTSQPISSDPGSGSKATAAMEAAPDFGVGGAPANAPTAAMPALASGAGVAAAAPNRIPAPPPGGTSGRSSSGGGKGLIYGLGGVAVLLVGGIAWALIGNGGDDGEGTDGIILTTEPTAATIAPLESAEPPQEPEQTTDDDSTSEPTDNQGNGNTPVNPNPNPRPTRPPPQPTTPPPRPPPEPDPTPTQPAGDPCKECASLAQGGNITGAAQKFQQCSDEGKKNQCSARAKRRAPAAAKSAITRQNCSKARQIQGAAASMNAGSAALDAEIAKCN
jgi:hypothetical protein